MERQIITPLWFFCFVSGVFHGDVWIYIPDPIFVIICVGSSWEEGGDIDAAHLAAQKSYHQTN